MSPEPLPFEEEYFSGEDIDQDILHSIPELLFVRPSIPRNFEWDCPIEPCTYEISLRLLTDENVKEMSEDDKLYLRRKQWRLEDERFQDLFYDMIERHYYKHLNDLDIALLVTQPLQGWQANEDPKKLSEKNKVSFPLPLAN